MTVVGATHILPPKSGMLLVQIEFAPQSGYSPALNLQTFAVLEPLRRKTVHAQQTVLTVSLFPKVF